MCIRCERKRDCLSAMSDWLSPRNYSILSNRIKHLYRDTKKSSFCEEERKYETGNETNEIYSTNVRLAAAQNFANSLQQRSKFGRIQCEVAYNSWPFAPDPIRRKDSFHSMYFVEYVSSSITSIDIRETDIYLIVRLFPMLSVGYVPYKPSLKDNVHYDIVWPSQYEDKWLLDSIPVVHASLNHCPLTEEANLEILNDGDRFSLDVRKSTCKLLRNNSIASPSFVEFCVVLPFENFADKI